MILCVAPTVARMCGARRVINRSLGVHECVTTRVGRGRLPHGLSEQRGSDFVPLSRVRLLHAVDAGAAHFCCRPRVCATAPVCATIAGIFCRHILDFIVWGRLQDARGELGRPLVHEGIHGAIRFHSASSIFPSPRYNVFTGYGMGTSIQRTMKRCLAVYAFFGLSIFVESSKYRSVDSVHEFRRHTAVEITSATGLCKR